MRGGGKGALGPECRGGTKGATPLGKKAQMSKVLGAGGEKKVTWGKGKEIKERGGEGKGQ